VRRLYLFQRLPWYACLILLQMNRAIIQLTLGLLQIAGSTFSLWFLLATGPSPTTIAGVTITAALTLTSVLLKRFVWKSLPNLHHKQE
jgi:hypothetical protein